jgi:hypothetical protein
VDNHVAVRARERVGEGVALAAVINGQDLHYMPPNQC